MGHERTCWGWCVIHWGRARSRLMLRAVWVPRAGNAIARVLLTPESALVLGIGLWEGDGPELHLWPCLGEGTPKQGQ